MPTRRPRILLVYAVPFSGHAQAAFALRQALEKGRSFEVKEYHFLQQWKTLGEAAVNFYRWMLKQAPEVWGHVHDNPDYKGFADYVVQGVQQWDITGLLEQVKREKPTAIIAFQSFPMRILAEAKKNGKLDIPLYVVTTDFWAHRYWAHPSVDHYFASTDRAVRDLKKQGIPLKRMTETGIPLRQEFAEILSVTQAQARKKLRLDQDTPTIFVMGGSHGFFPFERFFQSILSQPKLQAYQWLFLFGNDQEGLAKAEDLLAKQKLSCIRLYGFRRDVSYFMRASDVFITKAGGLSISEALAMNVPLVLCKPLPGQEQKNVEFLVKEGAAIRAEQAEKAVRKAAELIQKKALRQRLIQAERRLAHADAASTILDWVKKHTKA